MEEYMVKRYHVPFLAIPFEVWQAGPVAKDIFIDLSDGPILLKDYVTTEIKETATYIKAIKAFNEDEFSECEIEMMDEILRIYGDKTAKQLVEEVHQKHTLWYTVAERHGLLDEFTNGQSNNSSFIIDFSEGLTDCAKEDYLESLAIRQTANTLKTKNTCLKKETY